MTQISRFFFFSLIIIFYSCSNSPYPGFLQTQSGLNYKFFSLGEGDTPKQFDYVRIKYQALPYDYDNQDLPIKGESFFQLTSVNKKGGIEEAIAMLNKGDSAAFVLSPAIITDFFNVDGFEEQDEILLTIKIVELIPAEHYLQHYSKLKKWINIKNDHEQKVLKKYLSDNNIPEDSFSEGIYFIPKKIGSGKIITDGVGVLINYRGYFLSGEIFDDTFEDNRPFELVVGTSDQVILGLEKAIKKMKKGGKAKIIIPSHLGFGERGSSTGLIPPNTPVIYEVEILRVNN